MRKTSGKNNQYREGYSLPRSLYISEQQFQRDLQELTNNHWQFVEHISRIPNPGDYVLFKFGHESIIVIRDKAGEIRAHYNVCRHRGSRVCLKDSGNAKLLVCPYHAWSYDLEGGLRAARDMPEDFEPANNGLVPCHVRTFHGLIFISLAKGAPPDFEDFTNRFDDFLRPYDMTSAKIAFRKQYPTMANWKLCQENFIECYHCPPSHKTYSSVHDIKSQNLLGTGKEDLLSPQQSWEEKAQALGTYLTPFQDEPDSAYFQTGLRFEIGFGHETGSLDGKPLAPLMGDFKDLGYDGGFSYCVMNSLFTIAAYPDHFILYRFVPTSPLETDAEIIWFVREDAEEGRDYDVEKLIALWDTTFSEDKVICANNQLGVLSEAYSPGRYSLNEQRPVQFVDWYMRHFTQS